MRLLTTILIVAAAIWSLASYALFALARSGAAAVTRIEDLLNLQSQSLQWLADSVALVGPAMQVIVVIVWLLGAARHGRARRPAPAPRPRIGRCRAGRARR
jgi:hypothetical protein